MTLKTSTTRKQLLVSIKDSLNFGYKRDFLLAKFNRLFACQHFLVVENLPYIHIGILTEGVSRNTAKKQIRAES